MDTITKLTPAMPAAISNTYQSVNTYLQRDTILAKILKVAIISCIVIMIIKVLIKLYNKYDKYNKSSPWIFKGTKLARRRLVILQDPKKEGAVTIQRSTNEKGGLEFSYSMWIFIDDWKYKYGEWKHIMHKGTDSSTPLRAPGIWLHEKKNAMRVYMNTYNNINEFADVDNIPLNKWFHVVVSVQQRNLDIIINGNLAKRHVLSSLPKQNDGDIFLNSFSGFSGFMSNVRYHDYCLSFREIDSILKIGPSSQIAENDLKQEPPYFSYNWWINQIA